MTTWTHIILRRETDNIETNYRIVEKTTGYTVRYVNCGDYQTAVEIANRIDANWDVAEVY